MIIIVPGDMVTARSACPIWNMRLAWHDVTGSRLVYRLEAGEVCTVIASIESDVDAEVMVMVYRGDTAHVGWTGPRLFFSDD